MIKLSIDIGVGDNIAIGTITIPIGFFRITPTLSIQELCFTAAVFKTIQLLDDWMDIDGVDSAYYLKLEGSIIGMLQFYQYLSRWFDTYIKVEKVITTSHLSKEFIEEFRNIHSDDVHFDLL